MGNGHNDNDDDERKDLTRIEDLSEFLHEEDPELESKFGDFDLSHEKVDATSTGVTGGIDLDALDDSPPALPETPDQDLIEMPIPEDNNEEAALSFGEESSEGIFEETSFQETASEETPFEETPFEETPFEETSFEETPFEETPFEETPFEETPFEETPFEETSFEEPQQQEESSFGESPLPETSFEEVHALKSERLEDVKTFAQNFSYGQIQGGGNPPFSIVIRNLKYEEDKESIISLLSEFGLVTEQNLSETTKALEMGNLLVPQISEYSAIVLTHKLRRFDCDIEMGLSDEVHPSKSGEQNPRGLMKKDSLKQNKVESYKSDEGQTSAKEIIVSTLAQLEGYAIKKYIGIQTSFAIVDEEELERLKFVQEQSRASIPLHEYQSEDSDALSSEKAFLDYKSSFDYLFISLAEELKTKAQKEKANALLGLTYQLQPLPFEKNSNGKTCYQLTASATMAVVSPE